VVWGRWEGLDPSWLDSPADLLRPSAYVGSLASILTRIPNTLGVVRVENVITKTTAKRFLEKQAEFRGKYRGDLEAVTPLTLFHGTNTNYIGSIGA
jgi:hypothetical protein